MDHVCDPRVRPFDEIVGVAVAIRSIDASQRHVGVAFKDGDGVKLLHLAWHCSLRCEPPSERYHWIEPSIHPRRARQVAAICRQVVRANATNGIPFAFSAPNDCLDPATFEFLLGPSRLGLTCATFVLAVFDRAGLPLVRYETWPHRSDDRTWQQNVIRMLHEQRQHGNPDVDVKHLEGLRKDLGSVRYRPEEVAAAATCPPARFRDVSGLALSIVELLNGEPVSTRWRRSMRIVVSAASRICYRITGLFRGGDA